MGLSYCFSKKGVCFLAVIALAWIPGAWAGGHPHAGQCNPSKAGCETSGSPSSMMCAHGWCDPNTDPAGWGCCKALGGRVGCTSDYPFMCDVKVTITGYGASSEGEICENPTLNSLADYNTICEFPCWDSAQKCKDEYNAGVTTGRFTCGYVGHCNPKVAGCKTKDEWGAPALVLNSETGIWEPQGSGHSPMKCGDGSTCDTAIDGWACCKDRGKRASCAPDYPFMCKNMIPVASYSDGELTEEGTADECVEGSDKMKYCEHPCWDEASKCDQYGDGGLTDGVLSCAIGGYTLGTCGEMRDLYKETGCCGQPTKTLAHALST